MSEKAILVGTEEPQATFDSDYYFKELALLADTAGAAVVGCLEQKRRSLNQAFYLGRGKLEELLKMIDYLEADAVIFNDELTALQIRNLEQATPAKIIDRTALILDIFAQRARSGEGKLQVELAQLQYMLPRLTGLGRQLSKLGGGIGTRGPGETRLETDRRTIRKKIVSLKHQIASIRKHRSLHRRRRRRAQFAMVSLVGYTNAGKSTLINALTGAALYTEDKLFATLDPAIKKGRLNSGAEVLYTDTVGFIEKLPRQLLAAFAATLEEIAESDILLHVVDSSDAGCLEKISVVREHLNKIDPHYYEREIIVFNKTDCAAPGSEQLFLSREYPSAVFVSALKNTGLELIKEKIAHLLNERKITVNIRLPYSEGKLFSLMQEEGAIEEVEYKSNHLLIKARVNSTLAGLLKSYCV